MSSDDDRGGILAPQDIAAPFGRYSHGVTLPEGCRIVQTSGQLGQHADGTVPEDAEAQAAICFANIDAILREADMTRADIVHLRAFVTRREDMSAYMKARDEWLGGDALPPASTLVIVSGFTRAEFLVEVEATAATREAAA